MGLVIIQKKKPVVVPRPEISEFAEQIDHFGQLTADSESVLKEIKALQEKLKPLAEAKAKLQAAIDAMEIEDDYDKQVEIGHLFKVEIGKKGSNRSIKDLALAKKLLGNETFMKVASITLKNLDDYLTPPEKEQVLKTERTSRSFKVIARA